ncbi:MAG: glycoside hydrolase family 15 protein, partial [Acetobacteraceae bacterium]
MTQRIEDYALIGNCETTALVGRDGSIDWLALPRFDSAACFAALLGSRENGCWRMEPTASVQRTSRQYRGNTLILETLFETTTGVICLTDLLVRRNSATDLIRQVRGVSGSVAMQTELVVRFDYGSVVPWVSRREDGRLELIAGPDRLILDTAVPL